MTLEFLKNILGDQAFSQDFERESKCYVGWGHASPENFEKLKPLRCDSRHSDSCFN